MPDEHVLLRSCCDRVGRRLRWVVSCPEEIAAGLFAGEPGNLCLRKTAWWGWEDSNFNAGMGATGSRRAATAASPPDPTPAGIW